MGNEYEPNAEQALFHDDVVNGTGNTIVSARAGVGKTASIVSVLRLVPDEDKGDTVVVAFNADIARVLTRRVPSGVLVKTMHGLGYAACRRAFGKGLQVEKDRGRRIAAEVSGADKDARLRDWAYALSRVTSMCKGVLARTEPEIDRVIDLLSPEHPEDPKEVRRCQVCGNVRPNLEGYEDRVCKHAGCRGEMVAAVDDPRPEFIRQVRACLERATYDVYEDGERGHPQTVDFDDQCYLPVAMGLRLTRYRWVFCDEVQDLNKIQHALVTGSLAEGGRFFGVGDRHQAIYRFRGASADSMERLQREMQAKELPMTITYRCGQAIVREAQRLVPDFKAAPGQHEGLVEEGVTVERMRRDAAPGDFIISRTNAPLLGLCLGFLREGRRATIRGRDIGSRLSSIVRRAKVKTMPELEVWVREWAARESEKLLAKGDSDEVVRDTEACLGAMMEGARSPWDVTQNIERLFDDDDDDTRITLTTTHRAKGMERDRVWLLRDTYRPCRGEEEQNLLYVGITRAKHHLLYVRTKNQDLA